MSEKQQNNVVDVLSYNPCGVPLAMAAFTISKADVEDQIRSLAESYISGEFLVKIDTWVDQKISEYDESSKSNRKPLITSFQLWIPKSNSSIIKNIIGKDNEFTDGIPEYTDGFTKFVNMFGYKGEKNDPLKELGKHGKYIIVIIDPSRLFGHLFDSNNKAYNSIYEDNKCNRAINVVVSNLYDHENPVDVINKRNDKRRMKTLTGFLVKKYYANMNTGNFDTYRPALNTRRGKKYL